MAIVKKFKQNMLTCKCKEALAQQSNNYKEGIKYIILFIYE